MHGSYILFHLFQDRLLVMDLDLKALIKGTVNCTKRKLPSTKDTKKEAFDRYMHKLYGLPPCTKVKYFIYNHFSPICLHYSKLNKTLIYWTSL